MLLSMIYVLPMHHRRNLSLLFNVLSQLEKLEEKWEDRARQKPNASLKIPNYTRVTNLIFHPSNAEYATDRSTHSSFPMLYCSYECFTPPTTAPLTWSQSILSSSSSSTSPTTATLSPRIKYKPCGTSVDGSGSSGGRMTRSMVWDST